MQEYPIVYNESEGGLASVLKRIVELRRDDVAEFNELARLRGYASGFIHKTQTIDNDYSVGLVDLYLSADATSAALTLTLSSSPIDGEKHIISKKDSTVNVVMIDGNGKDINGAATLDLTAQYQTKTLIFFGGNDEWLAY